MCMIDGADCCEVWKERTIKRGRKSWKCKECGRLIPVGEEHSYVFSIYEGQADSYRRCRHCMVACTWLSDECGGYVVGAVADDIREHAEEYRSLGLWRLVVGQQRRWQRFDKDGLMAVPAMPALSGVEI